MGEFFGVVLPTATCATQKTTMAVDDAAGQGQATIVTQSVLNSSARKLRSGHFSVERDNPSNNYDR